VSERIRGAIVLGAPRSGTTLLHRLLDAHPEICSPPQTELFIACASFIREEPTASGPPLGVLSSLWHCGFTEAQVTERLRSLAFGFLDELSARANKPMWVEKTGSNGFFIDGIERVVGRHCKYVCIVRHGFDVALSTRDLCDKIGAYPRTWLEYLQRDSRPLVAFAWAWADITERMQALCAAHPDHALKVRYEDLVADPKAVLGRIFEFLGRPTDVEALLARAFSRPDEQVGVGDWKTYRTTQVSTESTGRWRSEPPEVAGLLAGVINPVLEREGYEPVPLPPATSAEAQLKRAKRALLLSRLQAGKP
jgi:protein-tyrosine sulfotransferase